MIAWVLAGSGVLAGACGVLYGLWMREKLKMSEWAERVAVDHVQKNAQEARHWRRACDEVQAALSASQDALYDSLRNLPDIRGMLEPHFRQLSAWRARTPPADVPAPTSGNGTDAGEGV